MAKTSAAAARVSKFRAAKIAQGLELIQLWCCPHNKERLQTYNEKLTAAYPPVPPTAKPEAEPETPVPEAPKKRKLTAAEQREKDAAQRDEDAHHDECEREYAAGTRVRVWFAAPLDIEEEQRLRGLPVNWRVEQPEVHEVLKSRHFEKYNARRAERGLPPVQPPPPKPVSIRTNWSGTEVTDCASCHQGLPHWAPAVEHEMKHDPVPGRKFWLCKVCSDRLSEPRPPTLAPIDQVDASDPEALAAALAAADARYTAHTTAPGAALRPSPQVDPVKSQRILDALDEMDADGSPCDDGA